MSNSADSTSPPIIDDLIRRAQTAARGGNPDKAEAFLNDALAREPGNPGVLHALGNHMVMQGRLTEAEDYLQRSIALKPSPEAFIDLANAAVLSHRLDEAMIVMARLLQSWPTHVPGLLKKAEILKLRGDMPGVRETLRDAVALLPDNVPLALRYLDLVAIESEPEALAGLEDLVRRIGDEARHTSDIWWRILNIKERMARKAQGLPPEWSVSWDDALRRSDPAAFANWQRSLLGEHAMRGDSADILRNLGMLHLALGNAAAADRYFVRAAAVESGQITDVVRLDAAFYEVLANRSDDAILGGLVPVVDLHPVDLPKGHIIYLGCDISYFHTFALPLLRSLAQHAPGTGIHVHIMDGSDAAWAGVRAETARLDTLRIALSAERPNAKERGKNYAPLYYHAIRFVRFYQFLTRYDRPMWMMDVDALFNRDPRFTFAGLDGHDIAARVIPRVAMPWNKLLAILVGVSPTPQGLRFARLVAATIAHWHGQDKLRWFMDQAALFGVYTHLAAQPASLSTYFFAPDMIDQDHTPQGTIWFATGGWKFILPQLAKGAAGHDALLNTPYAQAFINYAR